MKALLIIDIQNDFLPGGSLAVERGDEIIPIVNALQNLFDLVVATQDWHPKDHKSFAVNHSDRKAFEKIDLNGLEQVLWPAHCIQSTTGAQFAEGFNTDRIETIFRKGTDKEIDSYSGFYDNGRRKSTGLADYLRGKKVTEIFVVGLAADYCVYYSAMDALREGFKTTVIEDATRPIDPAGFEITKKEIIKNGGKIMQSSDIIHQF